MKKDTSKSTILIISLGFVIIFLVFNQKWAIYTALIIGLIGAFSDWAADKIEWLWFKLSLILSKIIPTILLAIVFYIFLFPFSLISKFFTNDPLLLRNNYNSTFTDVMKNDVRKSMEKTW
ncbi:MAG: rane protein [Sphingobacteriales bacterium]|nr:rane protein [Sphingobacteriales bacterium]